MFESFIRGEGWKLLLDFFEERDENALSAVLKNKSSDPLVALTFQIRLQERREALNDMQHHVLGSIQQKNDILTQNKNEEEYAVT